MRKLAGLFLVLFFSLAAVAQRGKAVTVDASDLHGFCTVYLTAFAPGAGDTYKDRKELVFSTRCFNYVSAVMDESAGAHWDTSTFGDPVVREWHWDATTTEVIRSFVKWIEDHPDHTSDPANIAIKESAVANKLYVHK